MRDGTGREGWEAKGRVTVGRFKEEGGGQQVSTRQGGAGP